MTTEQENAPANGDEYENVRSYVLRTANDLVNGDRNTDYGDPIADFQRTADMWSTYLTGTNSKFTNSADVAVTATDVAAMMAILKISRIAWSPTKADRWVDLAGYAACGAHCASVEGLK